MVQLLSLVKSLGSTVVYYIFFSFRNKPVSPHFVESVLFAVSIGLFIPCETLQLLVRTEVLLLYR